MTSPYDETDARRKRLLWRASHRGIREMDLLLGGFAAAHVAQMSEAGLSELETIIGLPDQDLLAWIMGEAPVPARHASATLTALLTYRP